jgi:glycine C-acetyltransferase
VQIGRNRPELKILVVFLAGQTAPCRNIVGFARRSTGRRRRHDRPAEKVTKAFLDHLENELNEVRAGGLYKPERVISSPQSGTIDVAGKPVLNFCANNYLGLADNEEIREAAKNAIDRYGYGMASVRFICGTQEEHKQLEARIAGFLGMEDTILYSSCFDANTGLFETLLGEEDAIVSDALNHASIIDGVRLCRAKRLRYANNDMADLEAKLKEAADCRFKLIATDGVFSMDGIIANLKAICDLAEKYGAMVMVDDSHAVGFVGANGRGTPEHCGVEGRVDIITGTLGKALGGASGGYTCAARPVVEWLRQRSRPYLFSNTLAPVIAAASLKVFDIIENGSGLRARLYANAAQFRKNMHKLGFDLVPGEHPIIPVMLGEAKLAQDMASRMLEHGVYVTGFSFPVVPKGKARIRTQMSAAHSPQDIDRAVEAFAAVGRQLGVIA